MHCQTLVNTSRCKSQVGHEIDHAHASPDHNLVEALRLNKPWMQVVVCANGLQKMAFIAAHLAQNHQDLVALVSN